MSNQSPPFSESIRALRTQLNLSQEQLASRLNISFATVNRWESGKVKPQQAQLVAVQKLMEEAGIAEGDESTPTTAEASTRRRRGVTKSAVLGNKGMEQML